MQPEHDEKNTPVEVQSLPPEIAQAIERHEHNRSVAEGGQLAQRGLFAMITGGVAGIATNIAGVIYLKHKLLPFENGVVENTANAILGKIGDAAKAGTFGQGSLAAGLSSPEIEKFYRLKGYKENTLARRVYKLGGEHAVALYAGIAAAAVAAGGYLLLAPKRKQVEEEPTTIYAAPGVHILKEAARVEPEPAAIMHTPEPVTPEPAKPEPAQPATKNWREDIEKEGAEKAVAEAGAARA